MLPQQLLQLLRRQNLSAHPLHIRQVGGLHGRGHGGGAVRQHRRVIVQRFTVNGEHTGGFAHAENVFAREQIGQPDKVCINIAGDGCFRMNMNELATASRYNIPIIQVVINNQVLGMVRQWQTLFYGKRYSQTVLKDKVDFCKVAEGLGCTAIRVNKKEEVAPAIEKAIALKAPVMIECMIPEDDKVFPMVPAGAPISEVFDGDDLKRQS